MNMLLVTAVLALGAQDTPAATGIDGKWLIVYAEEGGRRNNTWEQGQAVIADGILSYEGEGGKKRSLKLKIGKHQHLEATEGDSDRTMHGVYILGQDYRCISLHKGAAKGAGASGAGGGAAAPAVQVAGAGGSSGDFILILRRQRGAKGGTP
jgi:hypothetical protein